MDGRIFDPDGARDRMAAWKDRIDQLAADTKAMSDQLERLRVSAKDDHRLCEVTLDHSGNVVGLELSDRIKRVAPETVAQTIMDTIVQAKRLLADRSQEIIESTLGPESNAGRAIAERVRRQLDPEDEDEGR